MNRSERRRLRRRQLGLAMPRRPEHPPLIVDETNDDAVVADDVVVPLGQPDPRRGRLSRARLTDEELSTAVAVDDAAAVQLHAASAPEEMRDDHFVKRILERTHRVEICVRTNENSAFPQPA